jgi:hypothetical protein
MTAGVLVEEVLPENAYTMARTIMLSRTPQSARAVALIATASIGSITNIAHIPAGGRRLSQYGNNNPSG